MKKISIAQRLCRAGAISALYVALTYAFMPFAFGPFQFRPAEALCLLPLFFSEAIPALYVGCMLSNLASPFLIYDVFIGSLATLLAALVTYLVGKLIKNTWLKIALLVENMMFLVKILKHAAIIGISTARKLILRIVC